VYCVFIFFVDLVRRAVGVWIIMFLWVGFEFREVKFLKVFV